MSMIHQIVQRQVGVSQFLFNGVNKKGGVGLHEHYAAKDLNNDMYVFWQVCNTRRASTYGMWVWCQPQ